MDEITHREHVDLIREVFYYQSRFDGKTIVLKIDFPILNEPHFPLLIKDLAMLRSTGIEIIIVPGAREWIDAVLKEYDTETRWHNGTRIANADSIPFIKMAAFDVANRFMTQLSGFKANAVIGNFVRARGLGVIDGIDYEQTGRVEKINVEPLQQLLDLGQIPIFPCIGWNAAGKPYNLSSDEIALAVCEALKAEKLFFVTTSGGISKDRFTIPASVNLSPEGRVARMSIPETEEFIQLNAKSDDSDVHYMNLAVKACKKGVERVHLVDGRVEGVILKEIFSNLGIGTMVYANDYESIRNMRQQDISEVLRLMLPLVEKGILVARNDDDMQLIYNDFVVYEVDGVIHACGALHAFEDGQGEIAGIATNPSYAQLGMGKKILQYLIDRAKKLKLRRVFVLTTQTLDWFQQLGFTDVPLESLPEKKQKAYNHQRKSRISALDLAQAPDVPRG